MTAQYTNQCTHRDVKFEPKKLQCAIFQNSVFDVGWSVRLGINLVPKQVIEKSCYTVLHVLYTLVIFQ